MPKIDALISELTDDTQSPANFITQEFNTIVELHRAKEKVYGGSWCRWGMLLSIIPNIIRKTDRIATYTRNFGGDVGVDTETLQDTLTDLFVYCCKTRVYLAGGNDVEEANEEILNRIPALPEPAPLAEVMDEDFNEYLKQVPARADELAQYVIDSRSDFTVGTDDPEFLSILDNLLHVTTTSLIINLSKVHYHDEAHH